MTPAVTASQMAACHTFCSVVLQHTTGFKIWLLHLKATAGTEADTVEGLRV